MLHDDLPPRALKQSEHALGVLTCQLVERVLGRQHQRDRAFLAHGHAVVVHIVVLNLLGVPVGAAHRAAPELVLWPDPESLQARLVERCPSARTCSLVIARDIACTRIAAALLPLLL